MLVCKVQNVQTANSWFQFQYVFPVGMQVSGMHFCAVISAKPFEKFLHYVLYLEQTLDIQVH